MNHVFTVRLSRVTSSRDVSYEVIAPNASKAIVKAKGQIRRDYSYRGAWMVEELLHRGPAV